MMQDRAVGSLLLAVNFVADGRDRDQFGQSVEHDISFSFNIHLVVPRIAGGIDCPYLSQKLAGSVL